MSGIHHVVFSDADNVAGVLRTACGLSGVRAMGGGIDIAGKWTNYSMAKTANDLSCKACAAALYKALPARLKPPTIYTALKEKLGREPSNRELVDVCRELDTPARVKRFTAKNAPKRRAKK